MTIFFYPSFLAVIHLPQLSASVYTEPLWPNTGNFITPTRYIHHHYSTGALTTIHPFPSFPLPLPTLSVRHKRIRFPDQLLQSQVYSYLKRICKSILPLRSLSIHSGQTLVSTQTSSCAIHVIDSFIACNSSASPVVGVYPKNWCNTSQQRPLKTVPVAHRSNCRYR